MPQYFAMNIEFVDTASIRPLTTGSQTTRPRQLPPRHAYILPTRPHAFIQTTRPLGVL